MVEDQTADLAGSMLHHLGGSENAVLVQATEYRLWVEVRDPSLVDELGIKALGAYGVVIDGYVIQIVWGDRARVIAEEINQRVLQPQIGPKTEAAT